MIRTERLILRTWQPEDFEPFAAMNADPKVMEYFPKCLTAEESDVLARRISSELLERGWGFWAVQVPDICPFIGFIGISPVKFTAPFTPAIEIGWRIAHDMWNRGYATEGAKAALRFGFNELRLTEIVSFTPIGNVRSRRVMEKIGMRRDLLGDFDHPNIEKGSPLRHHVLYRMPNQKQAAIPNVIE